MALVSSIRGFLKRRPGSRPVADADVEAAAGEEGADQPAAPRKPRKRPDAFKLGADPEKVRSRVRRLRELITSAAEERKYPRMLVLLARLGMLGHSAPNFVGDLIARQLVSDVGRRRIQQAAKKAMEEEPNSALLNYLYAVTLAKDGGYREANAMLREVIDKIAGQDYEDELARRAAKTEFDILRNAWRVVDHIAHADAGELDDEQAPADLIVKDDATRERAAAAGWSLNFKEQMLQSRDGDGYLAACLAEFEAATTLGERLRAIKEMLRQSIRRQISFQSNYELAASCFDRLREELHPVHDEKIAEMSDRAAIELVRNIAIAVDIAKQLDKAQDAEELRFELLRLADAGLHLASLWFALPALLIGDGREGEWLERSKALVERLGGQPHNEGQLRAYLIWAIRARAFDEAEAAMKGLSRPLAQSPAALYFVNILQRQSRFSEAMNLVKRIHATMLSKPSRLNPHRHWGLVRRYTELAFLRDTANLFARIPQSPRPEGVILIAPRNVEQLRRHPLVVLLELKRMGWAVVPLVEGVLPRELTGIAEIDVLNGCVTAETGLSADARNAFVPLDDFVARPAEGEIEWRGLGLKHSLWEDARVNRRAYDVDFSCPALTQYLQRLCDWTERMGQVLVYAKETFARTQTRCGFMSLHSSRLPDSVFRLFCDKYGDPENLFFLQTANGYENYFANFSAPISTRCVVRNMTRHPTLRSASLPDPETFARYFEANRGRSDEVMERFRQKTIARQPAASVGEADPEAVACEERIRAWRAEGKKVAVLFGKVVCDSAVPFDGGPLHSDMKEWLRHTVDAVRGSDTLLLIKPHPHELNEQIATYLNQYFEDLLAEDRPDNVLVLGHRWFNLTTLRPLVDLGLIYNGTTAIEMAIFGVPCVLCNTFGPIDYPVGHVVPTSREHYEALVRFETEPKMLPDAGERAAIWLDYMSNGEFALDYRYHSRSVTNRIIQPYWIDEDLKTYFGDGDPKVTLLAERATGLRSEPDGARRRDPQPLEAIAS